MLLKNGSSKEIDCKFKGHMMTKREKNFLEHKRWITYKKANEKMILELE